MPLTPEPEGWAKALASQIPMTAPAWNVRAGTAETDVTGDAIVSGGVSSESEERVSADLSAVDAPTGTVDVVSRPTPREVADKLHALRYDPEVHKELAQEQGRRARESGERRIRRYRS